MTIQLAPYQPEDLDVLAPMMRDAFNADAMMHLGKPDGPPGYDDGSFLAKWSAHQDSTALTVKQNGETVGSVILWLNDAPQGFLGNLFIDAERQDQGLGIEVWNLVERTFPHIDVWKTETPIFSRRNHHFYVNKLGFHIVEIKNPRSVEDGSFVLVKNLSRW